VPAPPRRIAFLVSDVFRAYQAAFRKFIERAAQRHGCQLLVFNGRALAHPELAERAQNRLYDWVSPEVADCAIVLSGTVAHFASHSQMSALCRQAGAMPVVSIGLEIPGFSSIVINNRPALAAAVDHVAGVHGRRRIAYIGGPPGNQEAIDRFTGYCDALRAHGIPLDERLVAEGLFTLPSGANAMRELLARNVPFDAVVAANDHMALGAMDVLHCRRFVVPDDVIVTGFDDTPIAQFAARSLTTVAQPIEQMSDAAVDAVLALLRGETVPPCMDFDGIAVLRESCGCTDFAAGSHAANEALAVSRAQARAALTQIEDSLDLRNVTQRLSIAFDTRSLSDEFERSLPQLGVGTAYVALRSKQDPELLRPLVAIEDGRCVTSALRDHPADRLLPVGFPAAPHPCIMFWLVTFEREVLGLIALDGTVDPLIGEAVRAQVGAALKIIDLHGRVIEQTALQERFAREQLGREMEIAQRIQTALAPKDLGAPGFRIAASTVPAADIGGDYYDLLPFPGGAWLGIGDVAGHGLMSGLIMLMIQTTVSTLVATRPAANPSELVVDTNRVLVSNLHDRLQRDEHATFTLLRLSPDGLVRFAGAHEPIILWRARTRTTELVETEGTWLGLIADIRDATTDCDLKVEPGDLLVLFTDGMPEARNARGDLFGVDALRRIVEARANDAPQRIHDALVEAVRAWTPVLPDDITCVVARYVGDAG
jgi:DNA-binding LacI/PurR family transcriptional regulator/serine phosphatase RsbU (regulator of sigma subunit)